MLVFVFDCDEHTHTRNLYLLCEQVYQMYAQRSPEEVHAILRAIGADYLVLENSICYERRHRRGCRLRDLLDLANGHVGAVYLMRLSARWHLSVLSLRKDQRPHFPSVCQELWLFFQSFCLSVMSDGQHSEDLGFQKPDTLSWSPFAVVTQTQEETSQTHTQTDRQLYDINTVCKCCVCVFYL